MSFRHLKDLKALKKYKTTTKENDDGGGVVFNFFFLSF